MLRIAVMLSYAAVNLYSDACLRPQGAGGPVSRGGFVAENSEYSVAGEVQGLTTQRISAYCGVRMCREPETPIY